MKLENWVLKSVRQRLGYDENDSSHDNEIYSLNKKEIITLYLQWEGLMGSWSEIIYNLFEQVYDIDFNKIK